MNLPDSGIQVENINQELKSFEQFLRVKKNLSRKVVKGHLSKIRRFLCSYHGIVSPKTVDDFLARIKEKWSIKTYANYLASFKRYVRDYLGLDFIDDYEFPEIEDKPVVVPSKEELRRFFEALPNARLDKNNRVINEPKYKALFLFLASSGLRLGEALSLRKKDVDFKNRMIIPNNAHETNRTKRSWITFYNEETEKYLTWINSLKPEDKIFPSDRHVYKAFKKAKEITGIDITPQKLREWFCEEMGNLGVPDRYIDAFCGRVPKSVLAKNYTDYSIKKLKKVYEKAHLKILA